MAKSARPEHVPPTAVPRKRDSPKALAEDRRREDVSDCSAAWGGRTAPPPLPLGIVNLSGLRAIYGAGLCFLCDGRAARAAGIRKARAKGDCAHRNSSGGEKLIRARAFPCKESNTFHAWSWSRSQLTVNSFSSCITRSLPCHIQRHGRRPSHPSRRLRHR